MNKKDNYILIITTGIISTIIGGIIVGIFQFMLEQTFDRGEQPTNVQPIIINNTNNSNDINETNHSSVDK